MALSIRTQEGALYRLDSRIIPFSPVLQALDPEEEMPLGVSLSEIIHIHEFYLMFAFQAEVIQKVLQDIESQGLSYQQSLQTFPFLQAYQDSLEPDTDSLYSLTRKTVQFQFDDLGRVLYKRIGNAYVYRPSQGGEQNKQIEIINAEMPRILSQYSSLFQQINQRISDMFNGYTDNYLRDKEKESEAVTEEEIFRVIFGAREERAEEERPQIAYIKL